MFVRSCPSHLQSGDNAFQSEVLFEERVNSYRYSVALASDEYVAVDGPTAGAVRA